MNAEIGKGIYTVKDISEILFLPTAKVNVWFKKYLQDSYYNLDKAKITNFVGLIEFYVFYELNDRGFSLQKIKETHQILKQQFNIEKPFASRLGLHTLGSREIFLKQNSNIITLGKSLQYNLKEFTEPFSKKIEYSTEGIAQKYYPNGKESSVVVDPQIQFGSPTIKGTGVTTDTIYKYYKGGEKVEFIANIFNLDIKNIYDALKFKHVA